ncbi:MAG TPA: aspartate aminotransferase family protein [Alphaproteobacteria bacterium]|nr:aspartate aminotransferase family protein [Alphaproteobacteria bacterium]
MSQINRIRLRQVLAEEEERFAAAHPKSRALAERARKSLLAGVPMNWMVRWAGRFPVFVTEAKGAHFRCVDGLDYIDFCLGDTGAMTGHAPEAAVEAIALRTRQGITFMLPTEDAVWVGEELQRRFGLSYWQMALTATDANRFALRLARAVTRRPKILVFNWCYHGTVDETFITLEAGRARSRPGNIGPQVDPTTTTKVVEWNDIDAMEAALAEGDVAAVLAEPVLTNIGIVHPAPGFHDAMREVTRRTGTLLIIDETHTICAGPGGYTRAHGLKPDMLTLGKPIAAGVPAAVYGLTGELAEQIQAMGQNATADTGGIGGTLAGNALSLAAMRATLEKVLTEEAYRRTIALAGRFAQGVEEAISDFALPWHVTRLGCRVEYWFSPEPPKNGGQAAAAIDGELDRYMHLAALNRGVLMTPFHNMALIAPQASEADIDRHSVVFRESVAPLLARA